jgi:hypothetical protein
MQRPSPGLSTRGEANRRGRACHGRGPLGSGRALGKRCRVVTVDAKAATRMRSTPTPPATGGQTQLFPGPLRCVGNRCCFVTIGSDPAYRHDPDVTDTWNAATPYPVRCQRAKSRAMPVPGINNAKNTPEHNPKPTQRTSGGQAGQPQPAVHAVVTECQRRSLVGSEGMRIRAPSRAEPGRAGPRRAAPGRAAPRHASPRRAAPGCTGPHQAAPGAR